MFECVPEPWHVEHNKNDSTLCSHITKQSDKIYLLVYTALHQTDTVACPANNYNPIILCN